eukprot:TRINITY_DN2167_c0_g1_i3.p1 TRINITY_DN2167_c0_g1~~TRINITY_DN2167_c0_g1_i3.p1  ORF type:complete len:303 (+),score=73.10 TRINITY_DN2167_c0_g1_i3:148-1056(+)
MSRQAIRLLSTAAATPTRILVVDSYAKSSRDGFLEFGMPLAGNLYSDMIKRCAPPTANVQTEIVYPADPGFVVPDLKQYDGVAWSGSSYSVYAEDAGVKQQIEMAKQCFADSVPCFGSCWGLQIAAYAVGGRVELNPLGREFGIGRKMSLTTEGRGHPLFTGKKSTFDAFISHSDHVVYLPRTCLNLAGNDHSSVQALSVSQNNTQFWAVQYHPEYTLDYVAKMLISRTERLLKLGFFKNETALRTFADEWMEIAKDPEAHPDLKWKYGIDEDVLDDNIRCVEPANWVRYVCDTALLSSKRN